MPEKPNTQAEFDAVISQCREVFEKKLRDYDASWRIMRPESLTDQIYIKAARIRSLETKKDALVNEGIRPEFMGIVNYSIMALIQKELGTAESTHMEPAEAVKAYDDKADMARKLLFAKNHDYDEAWRHMRGSSFTDIILVKLGRIKQIEDNDGRTLISEGVEANYLDILNYAVFALIKIDENEAEESK